MLGINGNIFDCTSKGIPQEHIDVPPLNWCGGKTPEGSLTTPTAAFAEAYATGF